MGDDIRAQQATHRDFLDFVETRLRNDDNPELTIVGLDEMPLPGTTYLELEFTNVAMGDYYDDWKPLVRDFKPGSDLKLERSTLDEQMKLVAYIPYVDTRPRRRGRDGISSASSSYRYANGDEFDMFPLLCWFVVLLLLLIVAGFKVPHHEWSVLVRLFTSASSPSGSSL